MAMSDKRIQTEVNRLVKSIEIDSFNGASFDLPYGEINGRNYDIYVELKEKKD